LIQPCQIVFSEGLTKFSAANQGAKEGKDSLLHSHHGQVFIDLELAACGCWEVEFGYKRLVRVFFEIWVLLLFSLLLPATFTTHCMHYCRNHETLLLYSGRSNDGLCSIWMR
jgi:hypothetical protein